MEVSSVALELNRVGQIDFKQAVFTNFSGDHLDFHKTSKNYFRAKLKLFSNLKEDRFAIVNLDDLRAEEVIGNCKTKVLTYGFKRKADIHPVKFDFSIEGIDAVLDTPAGKISIKSSLIGKINLLNIMAAVASSLAAGMSSDQIIQGINRFSAPRGRLDIVYNRDFTVLIDYAHTDKALSASLSSLREILPVGGRLISVFGAGGDRDKSKRPRMGAAAARFSDMIILTNDNPRSEDPGKIVNDVLKGLPLNYSNFLVEFDRAKAINKAIKLAAEGDIIIIAGKGHEDYQIFGDNIIRFDDFEIVKKSLERQDV
jgi:UDP-N-acetylmuramoyl-L-alanyl-D-glutamate--2,6-diaminopimelate ligase